MKKGSEGKKCMLFLLVLTLMIPSISAIQVIDDCICPSFDGEDISGQEGYDPSLILCGCNGLSDSNGIIMNNQRDDRLCSINDETGEDTVGRCRKNEGRTGFLEWGPAVCTWAEHDRCGTDSCATTVGAGETPEGQRPQSACVGDCRDIDMPDCYEEGQSRCYKGWEIGYGQPEQQYSLDCERVDEIDALCWNNVNVRVCDFGCNEETGHCGDYLLQVNGKYSRGITVDVNNFIEISIVNPSVFDQFAVEISSDMTFCSDTLNEEQMSLSCFVDSPGEHRIGWRLVDKITGQEHRQGELIFTASGTEPETDKGTLEVKSLISGSSGYVLDRISAHCETSENCPPGFECDDFGLCVSPDNFDRRSCKVLDVSETLKTGESNPFKDNPVFPQKVVYYGQPKNSECAPLNTGAKVYSCTDDDRLTYRIIPCPAGTGCTADWNGARCVECDEGSEPNPCEASLEGIMHTVPWRVGAAEHDSSCSGSNIINSYVFGSEGIDEIFYLKDGEGGIYAIVTQGSSIEPATLAIFPNGVCESPEQLRIPSTIQEVETLGLTEKEKEIMAYFMLENNVYVDFSRGINSEERFQRLTEFSRTYPCDENTLCSFRTDNAFALMAQINLARGHRALSANDYSVAQSSYQDALANLQTALNKGLPATQLVINLRSSIRLSIARLNYKQGNVEEAKRRYREVIEGDHNIGDVALQAINEYVSAFGFPGERVSTDLGTGQISTLSITALKEIKSAIEGSARSDREFLVANIKLKIADVLITYGEKSLAEGALANVLSAQAEAMELCNSIVGGRLADAKILSGARQCRANANIQAIAYLIRLNNVELGTLPGWIDGQIESKISAAENDALQSLAQSFDPSALNIIHALQKVKRSVAFARKEQAASEGQEGSYQQYLRDIRNPEVLGLLFAAPDWGDTTEAERDFRQAVDDSIKLYAALIDRIDGRENPRVTIGFQGAPAEVKNLLKIDILHKMIDYLEDTPYPNNMILANAYRQELLRLADGLPEEIGQPIRESTVQNMLSHTQTVLGQAMQQIEEEFASREAVYRDSNTWWEGEIPALEIAQDATYGEYEETINQYVYDALGRSWNSISPLRILRDVYYTNYERDFDCGQEVDSKIDRAMIGIGSALLNRILSPETYPLTLTQPNGEPLKINGAYTLQEAVFLMGKGVIPLRDIIDKYGIAENQDVDEPLLYLYKFEELWPENVEGYLSDSPDSIRDKYDQFIRLNEIGSNGLEGVRGRQISGPVNWYYIKEKDGTEKIFIGCVNYEGLDMPESSLRIGGNTPRGVIITLNDVYGHFTNPEKNPWIANLINIEKNVDSGYFDILQHQIDSVNYRKAQDLRTHLLAQKESGQGFNPFLFQTYTGILQNLAASGDPEVSLQAIDLLGEATGEGIFEVGDQFSWGDTAYSSAEQLIHPGTLVSYMMIGHAMRITGIGAEIGSGVRSAARVFRSGVGSIVARAVPRTVARSFPDYSTLVRASFGGTPRFQMIIQGGRRIGQFILEETGEEALGSAAQFAAESLTGNPLIANIIGFIAEGGTSSIDINIDGVNVNSNQIDATRIRTQTDPEATKDLAKQVGLTVLFKRLGINANYEGDIIIEGESGFRVARMTEAGITFAKGSREVTTNTLADFAQGESGSPKIRFADEEINNQFMFTNRYINEQLFRAGGEGSVGTSDIESSLTTEQALEILGYPGSDIRTVSSMIPSVDINPDLTAEDLASIIKGAAGVKTEAGIDLTRDLTRWEKIGAPAWLSNQLTGPAAEMLGISAQLEGDGITVVTAEGESVTYSQHSCSLCTLYAGGEDGPQGTVISDIIDIAHRLTPEGNGLTDAQLESANRKLADLRKLVMDFDGRGVATELDGKHIEEVTLKFGDGETARNVPYEYQRFVYNEVEGDPNTQKIGIRLRRKNSDKPWLPFVYNQETDSWLFWYNPQSKDKRIKKHQQDIRDGKEPVELKLLRALHAKRPEWKVIDIRAEDVLDRNVDVRDIKLVNARGTKTDPNDPGVRHTADFWMPKRRLFQRFADDPSITFHDTETGADVRARITDMNLLFNKFLAFGDANAETDASIEKYDIIVSEQPIIGESVEDVRSILEIAELIQSNGLANYQVPVMAGVVDGKAVLVYDRTEGGIKLTPENVREVRQRIEAEEEVTDAVGDAAEASIRRGSRFDDMPVIERYKLMEGDVGYAIRRLQLRNEISSDADINPEIMARIQEIGLERIASRQGDKVAMLNEFYGELGRFADDLYAEDAWLDFRTEVQQPALLSHINILPESSPLKGILSEMVLVDVPLLNSELAATDMNSIQTRAYAFIRAERNAGTMLSQFYNEFNALQDSIGIRRVPKQSHFIEALTEDSTFGQTLKTWVDSGQIDISPSSEMLPDGIPRTRAQLDALAASMEVLGRSGGESFRAKLREFKARINAELSRVVEVTSVEFGGQVVTDTRIINLADRLKQRLIADGETRLTPERIAQIKSSLKNTILKPISDEIFGALGTVQPDGSIEVDATSNGLPGTTPGQPVKLKEARRGSPWHVEYSDTSGQVIGRIESSEDLEKVSINPETDEKIAAFNDFIDALPETEGAETETLPLAEGEYVVPSLVLKVLNAISNNIEFDESADVLGDVYLSSNPIPGSIWNFLPFMESKANRFGRLLEDEFTETEIGRFYELASTPGNILLSEEGSSRARHFNARMQRLMNEYLTDEEKTVLQDSFNNFYLIDFVASQAQRSWMDFYAYMGQIENYPDETPNPSPDVYYSLKQDFPAAIKIYNRLLIAVSIIGNELPAQEGVSDEILFRLAVDEEILRIKRIGGAIQEGLLTNFDLFYYTLNDGIVLKGDRGCAEKGVCSSGICYDNSGQCMVCRMPISYYEEDGSAADDIRFYKKVDNRACQAITENENPAFNIESVSYSKDETEESIVTMMSYRLSFTTPEGYGSTWEIDYSIKVDFTEITGEYATVSNIRETKGTFKKAEEFIEEINGPGHKIYHFTDDNQNNAMEPDEFYLSVQDNSGGRERIMTRHEFTEEEIGEIRQEFENQLRAATTT